MKTNHTPNQDKPGRNQFKCFHCRQIFASKEGNWYPWDKMEVHLCKECEQNTRKRPERKAMKPHKEMMPFRTSRGFEAHP